MTKIASLSAVLAASLFALTCQAQGMHGHGLSGGHGMGGMGGHHGGAHSHHHGGHHGKHHGGHKKHHHHGGHQGHKAALEARSDDLYDYLEARGYFEDIYGEWDLE